MRVAHTLFNDVIDHSGKRRHKAEVDSASAYGASSLSRFQALGNDNSDDDDGAGAALERLEEGGDDRRTTAPLPPPPPVQDGGMIRRGDGKAERKSRDAAAAAARDDGVGKSHHSPRSKSSSRRKKSDGRDPGYTPVRSVSQYDSTSTTLAGRQPGVAEQKRPKKKKTKKPRPPSMTRDAASKILTSATGGWTQTARNASYSRGHAPDSDRTKEFKNEYKSLKEKAYNRGQAL